MPIKPLIPLLTYKILNEKILVQKKGEKKPTALSIAQCNKLFNMQYLHGLFCKPSHKKLMDKLQKKLLPKSEKDLDKFLKNPGRRSFTVRYLNEKSGYSLFANENIPEDEVISIYSGRVLVCSKDAKIDDVLINQHYDMDLYDTVKIDGKRYRFDVSALHESDLARFALHLPNYKDLTAQPFDRKVSKRKILRDNLANFETIYNGIPLIMLVTTRKIKAGEMVGFNYGYKEYWKPDNIHPDFFLQERGQLRVVRYDARAKKYKSTDEIIKL